MRNVMVAGVLGAVLAAVTVSPAVARQAVPPDEDGREQLLEWGGQLAPKAPVGATARRAAATPAGPNPYLALVPDPAAVDYSGWARYLDRRGAERAAQQDAAATSFVVEEQEPAGMAGGNDTIATAETVDGFGTRRNEHARLRILGTLSPTPDVTAEPVAANPEDDGSIPLAATPGSARCGPGSRRRPSSATGRTAVVARAAATSTSTPSTSERVTS